MMLPTSYLVEKVQLLNQLAAGFNGRIVEVADWQLATIAETAAAIVVEVNTWRLEPLERPDIASR